ncbi:phosphoribosyl-AMP cyclohydrolase [Methanosarcina thermophila]|jgi:phosphoribosyl-AMP cyclohydrolase|uniref:Phosphoribosyl-AMP cyclohydrolase n=5 Tax=Methanosarcina thermophila TaxID=2210 RepID=A0A0E3NGN9_METTE|nr:Phosphoribosyl-AMP cyclohydrolase [Methanosarcina thermophila CHTI-55]SFT82853.1 phosphoribosyl-AMP cyclohydrolase [Methanosarcina thermophila]
MYCPFFAASFKIHSLSFLYLFYNLSPMIDFDSLKTENGLILAIVQDHLSKEVLMCAYMNKEALEKTVETGIAHFWSRSRQQLWKKGETSGHVQKVKEIRIDCDMDSLLLLVEQTGGACHMGYRSCFYRKLDGKIIGEKVFEPEDVY